jgi:hypothetical protein
MIQSETTYSRYFIIENLSIRLSDHISLSTTSDLQIIIPNNDIAAGLYTVIFGNNGKTLIWNAKQIVEFLPSMVLMKDMTTMSILPKDPARTKSAIEKIEIAKNVEPVVKKLLEFNGELCTSKVKINTCSACERQALGKKKSTWNVQEMRPLTSLFHKEFGRGDSINDDFQIFLNCTSVDYNDVLNIFKIVVVDNKKVPTIELLQEAYGYIK